MGLLEFIFELQLRRYQSKIGRRAEKNDYINRFKGTEVFYIDKYESGGNWLL